MAGYSGTPLAKKLGIKPGTRLHVVNAPGDYKALLAPLPENVVITPRAALGLDVVHLFVTKRSELEYGVAAFKTRIKQAGAIWVSWPKKSSRVPTEVTEDTVREVALPQGLVDVKVCAIDNVWSGLKLVIRKENRV